MFKQQTLLPNPEICFQGGEAVLMFNAMANAEHDVRIFRLPDGIRFGFRGKKGSSPAPTILVFATHIEQTLGEEDYAQSGRLLIEKGCLCACLDLPCHGEDLQAGEPAGLEGWRTRMDKGDPVVPGFTARISSLLDHLVREGIADREKIAAYGISRGGFMALHLAAADPRVKSVAAFGPVTELGNLREFAGTEKHPIVQSMGLIRQTRKLADRAVWVCIGNNDERVGTHSAVALARQIVEEAIVQKKHANVELHVTAAPGHNGGIAADHKQAALWIQAQISGSKP